MIKPWKIIRSENGPGLQLFNVRFDWVQNPRNLKEMRRVILETEEWINVVAVTPDKEIVIVRQFRFGNGKITTEIPGGTVEPDESPKDAAIRELKEETGYTSDKWTYLGAVEPNPAFQNNFCHLWLAEDVVSTDEMKLDDGEDISVETITLEELKTKIKTGQFTHALALNALSRVFNLFGDLNYYDFKLVKN
ncbi:NUDIX hydrolase [Bacteroidota bacterium]